MRMLKLCSKAANLILSRYGYKIVGQADLIRDDKYLDKQEFRYILWLDRIYEKIKNVPGHIVELGVARGRNSIIFGNLIRLNGDEEVRKYYGFDTFQGYTDEDLRDSDWLSATAWKNNSFEFVRDRIESAGYKTTCKLVAGDLKATLPKFLNDGMEGFTPGNLKVALLYVDCNAYLPAITGMNVLKKHMSPGGIICIDEKLQGGETKALIEFCEKNNLRFMKDASSFSIPAYTKVD
jgi:hypothetical protein